MVEEYSNTSATPIAEGMGFTTDSLFNVDFSVTNFDDDLTMVYLNSSSQNFTNNVTTLRTIRQWSPPALTTTGYIIIPLYVLIFLISVIGNTLVILTLIQNKRMRTVTNVFLLNLSVSDLLLAVFCMPFTIIPIMLKNFIFGQTMCILIRYLQGVSVAVSCFTLVAISLERYFAICLPLHSRAWQTLSHSYKTIIVCWSLALVIMVPIPVFTKHMSFPNGMSRCLEIWDNHDLEKAYAIFIAVVLLPIPIIIMCIAYGMICMTLWLGIKMDEKSEKEAVNGYSKVSKAETSSFTRNNKERSMCNGNYGGKIGPPTKLRDPLHSTTKFKCRFDLQHGGMRQSNSEKSRASKRRVIKMLFAVVYEFFMCWTPMYIIHTWIIYDIKTAREHITNEMVTIFNLLGYVSSCCNPVTYCFMNKNFRQGFLSVFRCSRNRRLRRLKSDTSYSVNASSFNRTHLSRVSSYDKIQQESEMSEM